MESMVARQGVFVSARVSDDDDRKQCCIDAEPHNCGDCYGGTEYDPYLDGENMFDPAFNKALQRRK
jgi:hypothetical protein